MDQCLFYGYGFDAHDGSDGTLDRNVHERELFNQVKYTIKRGAISL